MLDLLRLYQNASPQTAVNIMDQALKRKFLLGINPILRKNIFIFCKDMFGVAVTSDS